MDDHALYRAGKKRMNILTSSLFRGLASFTIALSLVFGGWVFFVHQIDRSAPGSPRSFQMGLNYWTPFGSETSDSLASLGLGVTLENSEHILIQVPWSPITPSALKSVNWLGNIARESGHALTIAFDWMSEDRTNLRNQNEEYWSFDNPKVRGYFTQEAASIAAYYKPDFLILGVEVDFLARTNPKEFVEFVTLYQEVYGVVKDKSPNTRVTVTFQFESLRAKVEDTISLTHSPIVAAFGPLLDIFGLSVYPCQSVANPDDLPLDYFSSSISPDTPTAIFETGWPTDESDEHVQAAYVNWLLSVASTVSVNPLVWTSTIDGGGENKSEENTPPCGGRVSEWSNRLGLWRINGTPKRAVDVWQYWYKKSPRISAAQEEAIGVQTGHEAKLHY